MQFQVQRTNRSEYFEVCLSRAIQRACVRDGREAYPFPARDVAQFRRKKKRGWHFAIPFLIPLLAVDYDFAAEQTVSMINCVVTYGSQFAFGRRSSM